MGDTAWKAVERRVAVKLGGRRNPGSGSNGGAGSRGDYLGRDYLYVETKHGKRWAVATLFDDTRAKAKLEKREPVCVIHRPNERTYLAVVDLDFLARLLDDYDELVELKAKLTADSDRWQADWEAQKSRSQAALELKLRSFDEPG
jgi:hypothetical protein